MTDPSSLRARYLDPEVLQRLGAMQVRARALAEGIIAGLHRSPHRGGSVEFSEYVEYSPGHELRRLDWKVYGKSDKYYIKQYEDETNLRVYLVLDSSGSMGFHGEEAPWSKHTCVAHLAATLGYLFMRQGDAVGAMSFAQEVLQYLPASVRPSHLEDIFRLMDAAPGRGATGLVSALQTISERARPRSLVILLSDMLGADDEALMLLRVLRSRRHEVVVFHALDPAELTLPYEGLTLFEGMEDDGELLVDPDDLRQRYLALMEEHLERVKLGCDEADATYVRFTTVEPLEEVALRFLRGRLL